MSALLAVAVQAVVTATSTPTPTPEVHAAVQAATPHVNSFLDTLNGLVPQVSQTDLVALGGALAVTVQAGLNKLPLFKSAVSHIQDAKRFVLAVALPFLVTLGASLASGNNDLHLAPVVFLVSQICFYAIKVLVGAAVSALSKDDSPVADPAVQL